MLSSSLPPPSQHQLYQQRAQHQSPSQSVTSSSPECNCSKPLPCPIDLFERALIRVFMIPPRLETLPARQLAVMLKCLMHVYAVNPGLADGHRRLATFVGWHKTPSTTNSSTDCGDDSADTPVTSSLPPARDAAMSGFFHTGQDDETVCLSCGIGLKGWQPGDFVDAQHANFAAASAAAASVTNQNTASVRWPANQMTQCHYLAAKSVLSPKTALVVKEAANSRAFSSGLSSLDDWKWVDDCWRFLNVDAHKHRRQMRQQDRDEIRVERRPRSGSESEGSGSPDHSGNSERNAPVRRRCITETEQFDEDAENDDDVEDEETIETGTGVERDSGQSESAIDIIRNVRGLGHSISMVTLAVFYHYAIVTPGQTSERGGGRATTPRSTIELLRAILQVEEALEDFEMTERDLPRFDKFLRYVAEHRPRRSPNSRGGGMATAGVTSVSSTPNKRENRNGNEL